MGRFSLAASSFENISRGLQLFFWPQVVRQAASASEKMTLTPSTDRTVTGQGNPLSVTERVFARCRLPDDVAAILIHYERDPPTAIEKMLASDEVNLIHRSR